MREFKDIKVAVAGTGYVGLSIATLLAHLTSSLKKHAFYNLLINNILYLCVT